MLPVRRSGCTETFQSCLPSSRSMDALEKRLGPWQGGLPRQTTPRVLQPCVISIRLSAALCSVCKLIQLSLLSAFSRPSERRPQYPGPRVFSAAVPTDPGCSRIGFVASRSRYPGEHHGHLLRHEGYYDKYAQNLGMPNEFTGNAGATCVMMIFMQTVSSRVERECFFSDIRTTSILATFCPGHSRAWGILRSPMERAPMGRSDSS